MKSRLLLMFLACLRIPESYGISESMLDFLTFYTGYWDNKPQIDQGGQDHDYVQCWITPVDVPALRPHPVVLIKELNNGVLRLLTLGVLSDGLENNTVIMKIYNFTDVSKYENGTSDLVNHVKTIKLEDLRGTEDCFAEFDVVHRNFISGNYPYCRYTINGKHPRLSITANCDSATLSFPLDTVQRSPMGPYVFRFIGPRQLLKNAPEDYVSPCRN